MASAIGRDVVDAAFFRDAYRMPLADGGASVVDVFFAVFGHHPAWMKRALIARHRLAAACGLATPDAADILRPQRRSHYRVGDLIGPWPVFAISATELVAGRDNRHLDFRLSVLLEPGVPARSAVISTVCTTHNLLGKAYLCLVIPFHTWGMKLLISRAQAAGRL